MTTWRCRQGEVVRSSVLFFFIGGSERWDPIKVRTRRREKFAGGLPHAPLLCRCFSLLNASIRIARTFRDIDLSNTSCFFLHQRRSSYAHDKRGSSWWYKCVYNLPRKSHMIHLESMQLVCSLWTASFVGSKVRSAAD